MKHSCKLLDTDASNMKAEQKYLLHRLLYSHIKKVNYFKNQILFYTWKNFPEACNCLIELNNFYWLISIQSVPLHFLLSYSPRQLHSNFIIVMEMTGRIRSKFLPQLQIQNLFILQRF